MHLFPIAHDGDMLKLVDIALHQEPDGRSDVLQVHARIQQLLGHRENHHVLEGVQSPRPRSVRWGDRWLDDLLARPIVQLTVRDAGDLGSHRTTVAPCRAAGAFVDEQLPLHGVGRTEVEPLLQRHDQMQPGHLAPCLLSHRTPPSCACAEPAHARSHECRTVPV